MSSVAIGIIVFLVMLLLIFIGVPVYIAMMAAAVGGFWWLSGSVMTITQFMNGPFALSASYTYAVVPLFMVVGILAGETGIASGAFTSMKKWLGRTKGGLLYATICANTIFGACSGLAAAGNVVFTKIAEPELERAGYNRSISLGCITAAGCLSALIPPSIPIITFCLLTDVSIGQALVCGVSGGLLLTVAMCICVRILAAVRPDLVPNGGGEKISFIEKIKTLKLLGPILVLFGLIVGGSFFGWFPATVGGAVAMLIVIIYAFARKMSIKDVFKHLWSGSLMFGGFFLIIIAGTMFSRFIALSGLADWISVAISSLNISPFLIYCVIIVFYLICGCLMEMMSMLIITVPIFFPLLVSMGYNPLVLVIVLVFVMDMAQMTPPIGMGAFMVASAAKVSTTEVFKGVIPFFLVDLCIVILIGLFPDIILWLPKLLS